MDRERVDELVRSLRLDELALEVGATIRPGMLGRTAVSPASGAALVPTDTLPRLAVTSPYEPTIADADLELVEVIGAGGMGVVWLARQRSLHRSIAIKRLADGLDQPVPEALALLAEGRTTGMLEHPNIVPVHALGLDHESRPLLVMKRIEGASLSALIDDRAHPAWPDLERRYGGRLEACVEILMRIADALHFAHEKGFVHRDVKPDNIMVGAFGEVYLLDWGIALPRGSAREEPEVVGTPGYIAPEMLYQDPALIDPRTDVYLAGGTLHCVLTGRPRHDASSVEAALYSSMLSTPAEYPADVPSELASIANRATSRDPSARFESALHFREALGGFLRHRASMRLCERARESLAAIGTAPEELASARGARTLAEARFGLTQALREWEGNADARSLLRHTLLALAEAELHRGSPDAAAMYAAELDPPEPALASRIEALRAEQAESRRLADDARIEAYERDPTIGAPARALVAGTLMAIVIGVAISSIWLGPQVADALSTLGADLALLSVLVLMIAILRKRVLANRWGRQIVLFVIALSSGGVLVHFIAWLRGEPRVTSAPYFFAVGCVGFTIGAVILTPRLAWAALTSLAAAIVAVWWRELIPFAGLVNFLVSAGVILVESRSRRAPRAP